MQNIAEHCFKDTAVGSNSLSSSQPVLMYQDKLWTGICFLRKTRGSLTLLVQGILLLFLLKNVLERQTEPDSKSLPTAGLLSRQFWAKLKLGNENSTQVFQTSGRDLNDVVNRQPVQVLAGILCKCQNIYKAFTCQSKYLLTRLCPFQMGSRKKCMERSCNSSKQKLESGRISLPPLNTVGGTKAFISPSLGDPLIHSWWLFAYAQNPTLLYLLTHLSNKSCSRFMKFTHVSTQNSYLCVK